MVRRSGPLVALAVVVLTAALAAQAKSPVEGVWKVAEVQTTGGQSPGTVANPQPGLYIFTRGYYSVMTVGGDKPRTAIDFQAPVTTDKDKIARYEHWNAFTANSGTYTIKGSTLTTRPIVAKNEGVMQGPPQSREFKVEGSTLWLIQKGGPAGPNTETRTKLTRVE
jgi:hypothetical protein